MNEGKKVVADDTRRTRYVLPWGELAILVVGAVCCGVAIGMLPSVVDVGMWEGYVLWGSAASVCLLVTGISVFGISRFRRTTAPLVLPGDPDPAGYWLPDPIESRIRRMESGKGGADDA